MNLPAYARRAAHLLRAAAEPGYAPSAAARARSLSTIERALATKRRNRRGWWLGASAAAAAVFVVVGVGLAAHHGTPPAPASVRLSVTAGGAGVSLTDTRGTRSLTDATELTAGSRVTTRAGSSAVLRASTGTRLALDEHGSLSVASLGDAQWFRLAEGALDAHVAKLDPGQRFVIETLDATVEVRGTAFRVTVLDREHACAGGARTRVSVSEGVVNVRFRGGAVDVAAGAHWPTNCDVAPPATAGVDQEPKPKLPPNNVNSSSGTASPTAAIRSGSPTAAPSRAAREPSEPASPRQTSLADQNDKFERAVKARRRGELQTALRSYREFVQEFPASPLAQNARVEVMRLLVASNPSAAAQAARDYLQRYPTGFARAEAERIVAAP